MLFPFSKWPRWVAASLIIVGAAEAAETDQATFEKSIAPFLKEHCFQCHGPDKQKSGIRYDTITGYEGENGVLWTKVHEALAAGEMPPEEEAQPDAHERKAVLMWIENEQRASRAGTVRRLNRREFSASLRDLTGLAVDYAGGLPEDGKVAGFDTGAEGLQDAADSVEQLMDVARRAVDGIRFLEPERGKRVDFDTLDEGAKDIRKYMDQFKEIGVTSRGKTALWVEGKGYFLQPRWLGERDSFTVNVPAPEDGKGIVRVVAELDVEKPFKGLPNPHLAVEIGGKDIEVREVSGAVTLTYEIQVEDIAVQKDGIVVELKSLVEMPYAVNGFPNDDRTKPEDKVPGGGGLFRPAIDKQKKLPPMEQPYPFVVLKKLEIDYDYVKPWPPAEWNAEIGEVTDDAKTAERLLSIWVERAYRRPVADAEVKAFAEFYGRLRADGMDFDPALRAAFQSVLLSGPFRYLTPPSDSEFAQYAIASRLSFMLAGAPPDDELRQLAAEGKLGDATVLDAQVDRLLDAPGSDAFFRPFVTQWLEMGQPITLVMDYLQKVEFRFGRFLRESMREETISYVTQLFKENRPVRELVDSDWTMMNNSLARHYGYENIQDGHLRKVKLRGDDPRGGGVFGHAGIQSMLCWMGDNWVIYRGAWTLRHILDDPPPPPPLEVPELDSTAGDNRGKTFKELLHQHQKEENCAVCHRSMDPLGFAFQNFDLSGRWRDNEFEKYHREELDGKIAWRGEGKKRDADATGQLPRGEIFSSFAEAKKQIVTHYQEDLLRGILKNLAIYGTGRQPDVDDLAEIRKIIQVQKGKNYPLRDVLKAFVRSEIFLKR